jgi:hypothetical protein
VVLRVHRVGIIAKGGAMTFDMPETPACERHGQMVADNEHGYSWHCAVCSATWPTVEGAGTKGGAMTLLKIAGLVNGYHNDGTTLTAAETLRAIADALGPPMEGGAMTEAVTRLEVIDETGRAYSRWRTSVDLSYQDGGRTLKVFVGGATDPHTVEATLLASYIQAGYTASEGYAEILRRLQAALADAECPQCDVRERAQ